MHGTPWLHTLMWVGHPDEDTQRRGRNLIALAIGLVLLGIPSLVGALTRPGQQITLVSTTVIWLGLGVIVLVARRGWVTVAAVAMVGLLAAALVAAALAAGQAGAVPFFLVLCVMIASVTLSPRMVAGTVGLVLASLAVLAVAQMRAPGKPLVASEALVYGGLLCLAAGMISVLGAATTERVLQLVRLSRREAEQNAAALNRANADLERQKQALQEALDAQAAQSQALRAALDQQRQLNALVAQLSLPVIPVRRDVLVIPVVGSLDSGRASELQRRVLGQIERRQARAVLLDITGVALVDAETARALVDTASSVRLLGARTLLVGIRPEVAQALVGLDIDLGLLEPHATLHQGLEALIDAAP